MRVNFQIMHGIPERADRAAVVARQLDQLQGQASVHHDPKHHGPLFTMLECLAAYDGHSDWMVILQDDADPIEGWLDELPEALKHSPEPVLGLSYVGLPYRVTLPQTAYVRGKYVLQGGAFAIRREMFDAGLVRWALPLWEADRYLHDDVVLAAFARWTGNKTACVAYSMFDQNLRSTLKGHPNAYPPAQRDIRDMHVRYGTGMVENCNYGPIAVDLKRLLQYRFGRQAGLVKPSVRMETVW